MSTWERNYMKTKRVLQILATARSGIRKDDLILIMDEINKLRYILFNEYCEGKRWFNLDIDINIIRIVPISKKSDAFLNGGRRIKDYFDFLEVLEEWLKEDCPIIK